MGRPKLSLPLGRETVLEYAISALRRGGVEHVLVVVGPHVPELVLLAESAGAKAHLLLEETLDMRATIEHGLRWLEDSFHPSDHDAWLLAPADHPTLDASVVKRLLAVYAADSSHSIVIPVFRGKRGHPALIAWRHVASMRTLSSGLGFDAYLRQHAEETLEMSVESKSILYDLDTPEDYREMKLEIEEG